MEQVKPIINHFDIPIAIFIFKRAEKTVGILKQIARINPSKIYIIGDGPRNEEEREVIEECRSTVERNIPSGCEVITNYAATNRGVYENIAGGAKWVFEREKWAIFLEDDNLPELTFFPFCREILHRYDNDSRVLWICGTNYLKECEFPDGASYGFTQNMMPCGWASWSDKFKKYYEGDLEKWKDPLVRKKMRKLSYYKPLKKQDMRNWDMELRHLARFGRFASWDYQMSFTLRFHNLYGIMPKYNQITNIGVDMMSIHGGTSFDNEMTKRFCGLPTKELDFPIIHPKDISTDTNIEKSISKIITLPLVQRIRIISVRYIKNFLSVDEFMSLSSILKGRKRPQNI